jgi:hypothetical protein
MEAAPAPDPASALRRAMAMPFRMEALLFVLPVAFLLAWAARAIAGSMMTFVSGVVAGVMLLSWLLKYAFVLLERAANGRFHPPAVAVEMLGPFEPRAALFMGWAGTMAWAAWYLPATAGTGVAALALCALPAAVAVVGAWGERWAVFDPRALWHAAQGLGWLYLLLAAAAAGLVLALARGLAALQSSAWWIVAAFALLEWFCLVGTCLYLRRDALGFEPEHTPERTAARARSERDRELARLLDELYRQLQLRRYRGLAPLLRGWFAEPHPAHIALDCRAIMSTLEGWQDRRAFAELAPVLVEELLRAGAGAEAQALLHECARIDPQFNLPPTLAARLAAAGQHHGDEPGSSDR